MRGGGRFTGALIAAFLFFSAHDSWNSRSVQPRERGGQRSPATEGGPDFAAMCDEPWEFVCNRVKESPPFSPNRRGENLDDLQLNTKAEAYLRAKGGIGLRSDFDTHCQVYTEVLRRGFLRAKANEQEILRKWGYRHQDLEVLFERTRQAILADLKELYKSGRLSEGEWREYVGAVSPLALETTQDFDAEVLKSHAVEACSPETIRSLEDYRYVCWLDGMQTNASFYSNRKSIVLCPGYVDQVLQYGYGQLTGLVRVMGHEIGHSIDAEQTFDHFPVGDFRGDWANTLGARPSRLYGKLLACFREHYAGPSEANFSSALDVSQGNLRKIETLYAQLRLESAKPEPDPAKLAQIEGGIRFVQLFMSHLIPPKKISPMRDAEDIAHTHARELIADYYSYRATSAVLRALPLAERWSFMRGAVGVYCGGTADLESGEIGLLTDGQHPSDQQRLLMAFRNPEIRQLLGCVPLPKSWRPWCGLDGAEWR